MLVVVAENALALFTLTGLAVQVPIYRTLFNVTHLRYEPHLDLVCVLGQNYHETFSVVCVVKVFGALCDDQQLRVLGANQCRSFVLSREGLYERVLMRV